MRGITIAGRLVLLAVLAAIGVSAMVGVALWSNRTHSAALAQLYDHDMATLLRLQRIESSLQDLRFRAAGYLLEQLPLQGSLNHLREQRTALADEWKALSAEAGERFTEGEPLKVWTQLSTDWHQVDTTLARLEAAYVKRDNSAITAVLEDDWALLIKQVTKPMQLLNEETRAQAHRTHEQADASAATLLRVGIGAGLACLLSIGGVAVWLRRATLRPLIEVQDAMHAIALGELDKPPPATRADELGPTIDALSMMQQQLRRLVGDVRAAADSISTASSEVAAGNTDLSSRTETTAASLQQAASTLQQLTEHVRLSAEAAQTASQLAASAAGTAQRGGEVVAQVVSTMGEIHQSSQRIADIIGVIDGIAFQTNILALNAAVEAARAGEQGRGFAVVAGEVRSLAQRSADAAREIKGLITTSVERVDQGSRLVDEAGRTMTEIVGSVGKVNEMIGEISSATGEQRDSIGQVNQAVGQLDEMTQQNSALVEQSAAAASSLRSQASHLSGLVGTFHLG